MVVKPNSLTGQCPPKKPCCWKTGSPYSGTEIQRRFGVPIWGHLAWQPAEAGGYAAGAIPGRRHLTSSYLDDVRGLDRKLAERDASRRALLGARR